VVNFDQIHPKRYAPDIPRCVAFTLSVSSQREPICMCARD
jgi:hypothetical protein